jgi:5'-deoxy-5'-methylthioadenosine phosphorylase
MKIAIIGGSLLSEIASFMAHAEEHVKTPFGEPSDNITIGEIQQHEIIYLNRHGHNHRLAPHQINYRANLFALKMLEVTHVIAVTAVGGITEKMSPMQWVVPDQIIDYTYGRMQTYNDGNDHEVNHIDFTYPFDETVRGQLIKAVEDADQQCISRATYAATQGPRLETKAEIIRLQNDGCDIVGMTVMPEAALAKELEMNYATLSLVVNWAAGKVSGSVAGEQQVSQQQMSQQQAGGEISMSDIHQRIEDGNNIIEKIMDNAISLMTNQQ